MGAATLDRCRAGGKRAKRGQETGGVERKTKTGVKLISSLVERLKPPANQSESPVDYIFNLVFLYRAYGLFVMEDYVNSLKDYIKAN